MQYLLISTTCLSITYIAYRLIFKNETNFRQLRFYLLFSILISCLIPLSNFNIEINFDQNRNNEEPEITQIVNQILSPGTYNEESVIENDHKVFFGNIEWIPLFKIIYIGITLVLILRILIQVLILVYKYFKSQKVRNNNYTLIYNHGFKNSFSFFNWIFINKEKSSEEDLEKIIAHENIHVTQYHSIDLLLVELLTAVMWFNPLIWMMKNSVQLVHEYLADEGVLKNGVNKFNYQALLINLVT